MTPRYEICLQRCGVWAIRRCFGDVIGEFRGTREQAVTECARMNAS